MMAGSERELEPLGSGLLLCQYKCQSSCVLGEQEKPCRSGKSPALQPHKSLRPARIAATPPPPPPLDFSPLPMLFLYLPVFQS